MKLTNKNILITGGAGFIGRFLLDTLTGESNIKVIDNLSAGGADCPGLNSRDKRFEFIRADIIKTNDLDSIFDGVEVVYHLAVKNLRDSLVDHQGAHSVNVLGTRYICEASQKAGVEKFIYISTSDVYGNIERFPTDEECTPCPVNVYGKTKLEGEKVALSFFKEYGLKVTVIRVFNTYGPQCHYKGSTGEVIPRFIIRALQESPLPVFGDGNQTRSFTFISDVIRGIILAAESEALEGKVINIGDDREYSIREIGRIIMGLTERKEIGFQFFPERPCDVKRQWADISLAKRILGFYPEVTIEEGIEKVVDWIGTLDVDWNVFLKSDPLFNWK